MTDAELQSEWQALFYAAERYEPGALALKIAATTAAATAPALGLPAVAAAVLLGALWLQEGIFRTSQARLAARLLRIEQALAGRARESGYRLHTEWLAQRPGTGGLVAEYLRHALRPTVAFPYPLLIAVVLAIPHLR